MNLEFSRQYKRYKLLSVVSNWGFTTCFDTALMFLLGIVGILYFIRLV